MLIFQNGYLSLVKRNTNIQYKKKLIYKNFKLDTKIEAQKNKKI